MYPLYWNMQGVQCIVIGAGKVAQRRIAALAEQDAEITVVALESMPAELARWKLDYRRQMYKSDCLQAGAWVFAATSDAALNEQIVQDAKERGCPVCSATSGAIQPDFCVPASCRIGRIEAAVTTGGASPGLSAAICREFREVLADYSALCDVQQRLRMEWKQSVSDSVQRHRLLSALSSPELLAVYREQGMERYLECVQRLSGDLPLPRKTAVVLISVGTSRAEIWKKTAAAMERTIAAAVSCADVYSVCTSEIALQKLRQNSIAVDTVQDMLNRLRIQGYTDVFCQPVFMIPGQTYTHLCENLAAFTHAFAVLKIGRPLLAQVQDFPVLMQALGGVIGRKRDTAYILVGHGSAHVANMIYPALAHWLQQNEYAHVLVGTIRGFPGLEDVLRQLGALPYRSVKLIPLMLTAGKHAQNDMMGEQPDSWNAVLTRRGYAVSALGLGLGEIPAVQQLFATRVLEMMV